MKITQLEPFILHVPLAGEGIADSTNRVTHWGVPGVEVHTDAGIRGYGYTGTLGYLPADRLIRDCIGQVLSPLVIGEDPLGVRALWEKMHGFPPLAWIGRAGVAQMALAAVDVALWDIKAKAAGMPLWKLLGAGDSARLEAYNTDGGWLNWSRQQLVDSAKATVQEGFRGVKLKIGKPDPQEDLDRIEAVRGCIGPGVKLMVDANCAWDVATAVRLGRRLADYDVFWLEEPLAADDVAGHARLGRAIATPIALGESLYRVGEFRHYLSAEAVDYVQPDATRVGGITPWLKIADLAEAFGLPVVPHAADMMPIHLQPSLAYANVSMMEYIPWLVECFEERVRVVDGEFQVPQAAGAGTTLKADVLKRYGVS